MILWHQELIKHLPRRQLLEQMRECCILRGSGWNRKYAGVGYVFEHPYSWLYYYHMLVIAELRSRGHEVDIQWEIHNYRGRKLKYQTPDDRRFWRELYADMRDHAKMRADMSHTRGLTSLITLNDWKMIYPEHDSAYLRECVGKLNSKRIKLINGKSLAQFQLELDISGELR